MNIVDFAMIFLSEDSVTFRRRILFSISLPILLFFTSYYYSVERKVFAFSKWEVNHFLNVFTIFNQLYNCYCLLLPSPNVSQAFQFRPSKKFLVAYAYAISSKTQKLSVQPNTEIKLF
jgi:hypothetical protein